MPRPPRGRRTTTVIAAMVAVVALAGAALWLEMRAAGRFGVLLQAAGEGVAPVDALAAAGRARRFLFLTDIPGSDAPDRLAGATAEALARSVGLDALVVSVSEDHQAVIDRFMGTEPEDASILIARPAAAGGAGTPLLPLYRRIRALNRELGAARSVRIIAADPPGWPPARSLAPAQAVQRWAGRDEHMEAVFDSRVLARDSRARAIFFLDGLHALRAPFVLRTGGTAPVEVEPLAARLARRSPREVWSVLVDVPPVAGIVPSVAVLAGSAAREALRNEGITDAFAVLTTSEYGAAADWLLISTQPGVSFAFADPGVGLAGVANAYVHAVR